MGVRGYGLAASDHASAKMTLISLDDHDGREKWCHFSSNAILWLLMQVSDWLVNAIFFLMLIRQLCQSFSTGA